MNECIAKKNDDDLLNSFFLLSLSRSLLLYAFIFEQCWIWVPLFFCYLKMFPPCCCWWWWSSSSSPLSTSCTPVITHERCPTINNNTPHLLLHAVYVFFFLLYVHTPLQKNSMNEQLTVGGQYSFNLISLKLRIGIVMLVLLLFFVFLLFGCSFVWTIDASMCINEDFFIIIIIIFVSFLFLFFFSLHHMVSLIVDVFVFVLFLHNVIYKMNLIYFFVLFFYLNTVGTYITKKKKKLQIDNWFFLSKFRWSTTSSCTSINCSYTFFFRNTFTMWK